MIAIQLSTLRPAAVVLVLGMSLASFGCSGETATNGRNGSGQTDGAGDGNGDGDKALGGDAGLGRPDGFGNSDKPTALGDGGVGTPPVMRVDELAECASTVFEPEVIVVEKEVPVEVIVEIPAPPVALYVMLDKSGSMDCNIVEVLAGCNASNSRWGTAVSSLKTFAQDAASDGIEVALQYFALDAGACDGGGYATPAVPMGVLPGNAAAIISSLDSTQPSGGTPTEGALRGLTSFCTQFQADNPDKRCVGVLITDGAPSGCNGDATALSNVAADALASSEVLTFTVGMEGANFGLLDSIASAGGSDCDAASAATSCNASTSPTALLDALNLIRNQVTQMVTTETHTETEVLTETLECEWGVPEPPEGETLDPAKVNVQYTRPDGSQTVNLGNVPTDGDCEGVSQGWYYDDNDAPTKIFACPSGCDAIQALPGGRVDIVIGCETMPAIPL